MKVSKDMSKFKDLISNEISSLAQKTVAMQKVGIDSEKIESLTQSDLQIISKGFMNSNLHELKPLLEKYRDKERELLKRYLTIQSSGQKLQKQIA